MREFKENASGFCFLGTREIKKEHASLEPVPMPLYGYTEKLVGGNPFEVGKKLDAVQGDNRYDIQGDGGLVSVCNLLRMAGMDVNENQIIRQAMKKNLCDGEDGSTTGLSRMKLLESYGISSTLYDAQSPFGSVDNIAKYVEAGHGVLISVNSGYAWDKAEYVMNGTSNHCLVVTGTVREPITGLLEGLIVCDSGLGQSTRYMSWQQVFDSFAKVPNASMLVTNDPIR